MSKLEKSLWYILPNVYALTLIFGCKYVSAIVFITYLSLSITTFFAYLLIKDKEEKDRWK